MSYTRNLIHIAIFIALGLILPVVFHMIGGAGSVFLPMHIPVFIAGLVLGGRAGMTAGVLTPIVSSVMTGMPPMMPVLPVMLAELGIYGAAAGYLYKDCKLSVIASLVAAMILGRLGAWSVVFCFAGIFGIAIQPMAYITGAIISGIPGMVIQLLFVPVLVKRLERVSERVRVKVHES